MLKIDRESGAFQPLTAKVLKDANLLERTHLQKMIVNSPDAFFEEMGEKLLLIGEEVKPSELVGDRIDLLAIDEQGQSVIIELKRHEQKLQLLQALSYGAMIADWDADRFIQHRSTFAQETAADAQDSINDHLDQETGSGINGQQRIILVAEGFDYALLKTAEWLFETYGIGIRCYRLSYVADGTTEYIACNRVYPPTEIVDVAARIRKGRSVPTEQDYASWDEVLAEIVNGTVRDFFKAQLGTNRESRLSTKEIFFRIGGQRRYGVCVRRKRAWVAQLGRFDGDIELWKATLSEPAKVSELRQGAHLSFVLVTSDDFARFLELVQKDVVNKAFVDTDETIQDPALIKAGVPA